MEIAFSTEFSTVTIMQIVGILGVRIFWLVGFQNEKICGKNNRLVALHDSVLKLQLIVKQFGKQSD